MICCAAATAVFGAVLRFLRRLGLLRDHTAADGLAPWPVPAQRDGCAGPVDTADDTAAGDGPAIPAARTDPDSTIETVGSLASGTSAARRR